VSSRSNAVHAVVTFRQNVGKKIMIIRKHVGEKLFFQILNKFGDGWGFLPIEMKSSAATEEGFESLLVR